MRRALDVTLNVLLGASLLLLALVVTVPRRADISFHKVAGTSMAPTINRGEVIVLKRVAPAAVQAGDIIGFRVPGVDTPVVHRVVRVVFGRDGQRVGFVTRGDNVEDEDPWVVRPEDLLGVVVFHVPFVGFLEEVLATPAGFGLLVVVPGALLLAAHVRELISPPVVPRRRRRARRRRGRVLAWAYWGLGMAVAVYVGLQGQARVQERDLASFAPSGASATGFSRTFRNDGPVPTVLVLVSRERDIVIGESYVWLGPGEARQVYMAGPPDARVTLVGFFPLLPPGLLVGLVRWMPRWAPLVATLLPAVPLLSAGAWLLRSGERPPPRRDLRLRRRVQGV